MCVHTWADPEIYQIRTLNQANQNDWPKETQKKCPIKVVQTATRAPLSDSLSPWVWQWVYTHTHFFPLLINTLLASLFSIFVEIPCCKTKGPGTLSLTTLSRLGSSAFTAATQLQSLAGDPSRCRLEIKNHQYLEPKQDFLLVIFWKKTTTWP